SARDDAALRGDRRSPIFGETPGAGQSIDGCRAGAIHYADSELIGSN
ncbi:MAG: hypothetical protein ACI93T_004775, partial [Porticoccaceae bacterium]